MYNEWLTYKILLTFCDRIMFASDPNNVWYKFSYTVKFGHYFTFHIPFPIYSFFLSSFSLPDFTGQYHLEFQTGFKIDKYIKLKKEKENV